MSGRGDGAFPHAPRAPVWEQRAGTYEGRARMSGRGHTRPAGRPGETVRGGRVAQTSLRPHDGRRPAAGVAGGDGAMGRWGDGAREEGHA